MPSSTTKKVVIYRFDRQPAEAFVNPATYLQPERIEFVTLDGTLQNPSYEELKALCFISETGRADLFEGQTIFERRPKVPGLWTRFYFRDGDRLDGVLSHNLLDWPNFGYLLIPPRSGANRQRVFVPRAAVMATELRGVIGSASGASTKEPAGKIETDRQLTMFEP